ncbi:MAG: RNA polymerase sigma factor [Proteobacteria bacterium]|nr:RNA polymerase sigma factor [Pseudomonadota bacterium]
MASQDTSAFGELVRRHQSQVRNFLRKLTRDESLADDLAQDCFMHAWDKIQAYSGRGTFIGWVLKIAYTTFLQSRRKSGRYQQVLRELEQQGAAVADDYVTESDELSDLDKFLSVLGEQERVIMIYSYACGLSHREISDATDLPAGTVKSIIFRAKVKIRNEFEIENHQHG